MSYVIPDSVIQFLSDIPFDTNYENTMYFANAAAQNFYMESKVQITLPAQSYTRAGRGVIRVGLNIAVDPTLENKSMQMLFMCNYMRFRNSGFENKWWYAFIDSVEYVNNNAVEIAFHIDVIQTFMFNLNFNECLIEREHVTDDTWGANTYPEQLETGPYRSVPIPMYLEDERSPTGVTYMMNRFEYIPIAILATSFKISDLDTHPTVLPDLGFGYAVPGIALETGQYYSGVKYYPFALTSGGASVQGEYRIAVQGNWVGGAGVEVGDVSIVNYTSNTANAAQWASYMISYINTYSAYYMASQGDGVTEIRILEKEGFYGTGVPYRLIGDAPVNGITVVTITPGSAGAGGDIDALNRALYVLTDKGKTDGILGIFMMPREFYPNYDGNHPEQVTNGVPPLYMRAMIQNHFDNYVPRNNKLYCYPYNMIYVTNNVGNDAEYKFENFANIATREYVQFRIWGNLSMNPGMFCAPNAYNGHWIGGTGGDEILAIDDELTISGFPMCSYVIDSFRAWLAQNGGTILATGATIAGSWIANIAGGAMAGAGLMGTGAMSASGHVGQHLALSGTEQGMLNRMNAGVKAPSTGLIGATLGALGTLYDHSRRPPQVHGNNNGNLSYQAGQLTFSFYRKCVRGEYARKIDAFFDMYGYKTNRVGTPNLHARPKYTYVKTIGCSLQDTLPNDYLREIEQIFDKGIRFWDTSAVFGNYNPAVNDNTIV